MKVVQLTNPERIEVKDVPARREAEPFELLLAPRLVGLTGVDALRFRKGAPLANGFRQPHIPGSEFVARVASVGRGVDARFEGARVVADPVSPCLHCEWCRRGAAHLCPNSRMLGRPPVHGALQERFAWPASQCVVVPDSIPDEQAVMLVPLSLAIHIVDHATLPVMGSAVVLGCGSLGLLLIQVLRTSGAGEILAIDPLAYRREAALEHGATIAMEPAHAEEAIRGWPLGGADVVIDVSNASEASRQAVSLARAGGRVLLGGIPADNRVLFGANDARQKELTIQFVRRPHNALGRATDLLRSGRLDGIERIVTHRFPLAEIAEAHRLMRSMNEQVMKVVVEVG